MEGSNPQELLVSICSWTVSAAGNPSLFPWSHSQSRCSTCSLVLWSVPTEFACWNLVPRVVVFGGGIFRR